MYKKKATRHIWVISFLSSLRSCDKCCSESSITSNYFIIAKMPVTTRSKSTGNWVDVANQEGTNKPPPSQAVQGKVQDESLS